jgi:hypothetical protein
MRKPDYVIGSADRPYMLRWWLIPRNRWLNIYLHKIMRDDDDRALHDHPWANVSLVLSGAYREIMPDLSKAETPYTRLYDLPIIARIRQAGCLVFRRATDSHRLEVVHGPVWSLFITGPWEREWGFHCKQGWVWWRHFVNPSNSGEIGKGCD